MISYRVTDDISQFIQRQIKEITEQLSSLPDERVEEYQQILSILEILKTKNPDLVTKLQTHLNIFYKHMTPIMDVILKREVVNGDILYLLLIMIVLKCYTYKSIDVIFAVNVIHKLNLKWGNIEFRDFEWMNESNTLKTLDTLKQDLTEFLKKYQTENMNFTPVSRFPWMT